MARMNRVITDRGLQRSQHLHSLLVTLSGLSGVILAAALATVGHGVPTFALVIFAVMFFPIAFAVTVGFHRHFTHRSFRARTSVRMTLAALGCMAAQGPVTFWVALHRHHHELADRPGDPHSPNLHGSGGWRKLRGVFHAYIGWTLQHEVPNVNFYARDVLADQAIMAVNRNYHVWILLGLALPTLAGWLVTQTVAGALLGFVWGGLLRMFAIHNMIWWITSFAHAFGSRDLDSRDLSRNNPWIVLPTLGEGWHNNHHAFPSAAVVSFHWWQVDPTGWAIRALEWLGLAWDVQVPTRAQISSKLNTTHKAAATATKE